MLGSGPEAHAPRETPVTQHLQLAIRAATVLGKPFIGLWALESSRPMVFEGDGLSAESLAAKYEQTRSELSEASLPPARVCQLAWITRESVYATPTVLFGSEDDDSHSARLLRAVRVLSNQNQCLVVAATVLHAGWDQAGANVEHRNDEILRKFQTLTSVGPASLWLSRIDQILSESLARLRSISLARRSNGG